MTGARRRALAAVAAVVLLAVPAPDAVAQAVSDSTAGAAAEGGAAVEAEQEAPSRWKRGLELAGSLFVGNEPQGVLTTRATASHADSTFELDADVRFVYGESSREGTRAVSQRLWFGSVSLDLWPFASQSPFLLGTVESSFARRIDVRVSGGVGHKMTFVDTERARANVSLALLGERSRLPTAEGGERQETLARWSARVQLRRHVGTRVELEHQSFYRPEAAGLRRFTFTNSSSAGYRITERLNAKLTYLDNYDSEARLRGARSNYDGQIVVGLAADF